MKYAASLASIREAAERIGPHAHRTPIVTCTALDELAGRRLFFKCENLQKVGAFKIRGACNAVMALSEAEAARGVVTHSSGNHAQALALAARLRGIPAHVVMPSNAPAVKRRAVEGYGATVYPCEPTLAARVSTAEAVLARTGGTLVPPYDHPLVIAGQGTVGVELAEQVADLDVVVVPVSGGGLVSGIALALAELAPHVRVVAAEPSGADDAARSKATGERVTLDAPRSIADGLLAGLGELTWPVVRDRVARVVTVSDDAIVRAMRLLFERTKLVVEPSGAIGLAVVLDDGFRSIPGQRVGVVLSGGNVDLDALPFSAGSG